MEVGEIGLETDQDPSVLEVPAVNWAKLVGVKRVQYIKMGHAPKVDAEEPNDWDLGNAVKNGEAIRHRPAIADDEHNKRPKSPQNARLARETTARQNARRILSLYKKKLSTRYGLIFYEDRKIVAKNMRTTVISLLHEGHPDINKMLMTARHCLGPRITEAI